jgi:NADPH2:quinone reductase
MIPDGIDFPEAAGLVINAATAYEGLVDRAKLQPGETVLVTAASGGVGSAAIQIAKSAGARVFAVASARNHSYVRDLGAEIAVDYHRPDFVDELRDAVPRGFDVLFDATGNEVRDQTLGLVHRGGRGVLVALGAQPLPSTDEVEIETFGATVNSTRLQAVAELISSGSLRMPVEAEFPLERAREALEQVGARHSQGRVVLQIRG